MDIFKIGCIILLCICILLITVLVFINHKYTKTLKGMSKREADNVEIKKGTRYTIDQTVIDENGETNVTYSKEDIILNQNKTEIVGIKSKVKPGKYVVLSTKDEEEAFNLRIGDYVKEYKHNEKIVLAEGQEITALSSTVILR